jgi:ribokinase
MSNILVVGSLNMDLIVTTPRVPVIGETILGSGFSTAPGGKGANQAVAAARLGGSVSMVGCVGNDIFGNNLLDNLEVNGVSTNGVKVIENCPTGVAVIVLKGGDNFIIVDPGSNYKLTPEMIDGMEEKIKECSIMMIQLEIPIETVERAISIAKKHGVTVLLNPAPAVKLSDEFISKVDIFTPNESECELITGISVKSVDDAKLAIEYLKDKGVQKVIITMGSKGVVYNSGNEIVHKPAYNIEALDATAAGDSFSAAIAVAFTNGKNIDEAIDFANTVGALTVMKKGAQPSLPFLEEVERFRKEKL